jgi:hypothetical protein
MGLMLGARMTGLRHAAGMLLAIACVPALAADPEGAAEAHRITQLEEVVVTGELTTLSGVRTAMRDSEDRFYARFNDLNQDDEFDIGCRVEAPIGTRLKVRKCDPKSVDTAMRAEVGRVLSLAQGHSKAGGTLRVATEADARRAVNPALRARMLELVRKDPELLRALLERARLQQIYDSLSRQKLEGRLATWD